jgi:hypothetical protein
MVAPAVAKRNTKLREAVTLKCLSITHNYLSIRNTFEGLKFFWTRLLLGRQTVTEWTLRSSVCRICSVLRLHNKIKLHMIDTIY